MRRFSSAETFQDCRWLREVLEELWPFLRTFLEQRLFKGTIQGALQRRVLSSAVFERCSLGGSPPKVRGLKAFRDSSVSKDAVELAMDMDFEGDEVDISLRLTPGLSVGVSRFRMRGTFCVVLRNFVPQAPLISGFTFFFMNRPKISVTWSGVLHALPVGLDVIQEIIEAQLAAHIVLPNRIAVPLVGSLPYYDLMYPPPDGVLEVEVGDAFHVGDSELELSSNVIGKLLSGGKDRVRTLYGVFKMGTEEWTLERRQTELGCERVSWGQAHAFVVDKAHGQRLLFELWGAGGKAHQQGRLLATLELSAASLVNSSRSAGHLREWPLAAAKGVRLDDASLTMKATFRPFCASMPSGSAAFSPLPRLVNEASAVLLVTLDRVEQLPDAVHGCDLHAVLSGELEADGVDPRPAAGLEAYASAQRAEAAANLGGKEEQVRFLLELPATHGGRPVTHQGIAWLLGIPEEEVAAFALRRCGVRATFEQQMRVWVRNPWDATVTLELREGPRDVPLGRAKLNVAQLLDKPDWVEPLGRRWLDWVNPDLSPAQPTMFVRLQLLGVGDACPVRRESFFSEDVAALLLEGLASEDEEGSSEDPTPSEGSKDASDEGRGASVDSYGSARSS